MSKVKTEYTLAEIAAIIGGKISGDSEIPVRGVASIRNAGPADLTFLAEKKYIHLLEKSKAAAVICTADVASEKKTLLHVKNPNLAFGMVVELFYPPVVRGRGKVHETSLLGKDVSLGRGVTIGPYVTIGDRCSISGNVSIGPLVSIGDDVEIGESTRIDPRVTIYSGVRIGRRCRIQAGSVLGSDGFGFARDDQGRHRKIPQIGGLVIEDDVEIGSNCTIDRGSLDDTIVSRGTKLDNLVHIAHNVKVGENTLLVAQVGIAGSTIVGKNVVLAGQAGISDHLEIGDGAMVGAQAGVIKSIPPGETVSGYPARPHRKALKTQASLVKIPQMIERIKNLEEKVRELEDRLNGREESQKRGKSR